jgi:glycosyltransferase involved in cell wall biosynthesis
MPISQRDTHVQNFMMTMPHVSVVMGVYNGADLLPETIDSVLAQTESDFEFIIVNDGSTDPQVEKVLSEYAHQDTRIKVLSKSNEGLACALIDGCAAARGKYIARIDVGDVMLPQRLEKQKEVLDNYSDVVLVTCWTDCCGPEWEHLYTSEGKGMAASDDSLWIANVMPVDIKKDLLDGPTHHGSVMFRTDTCRAVGGYRPQFYYGQDWDLWYRLAQQGCFAGVQKILYRCRIFPDGISMRSNERQRRIHACSRGAFLARRKNEDETPYVAAAATIRPDKSDRADTEGNRNRAAGHYFIGEALRRNGDRRCRKYFRQAMAEFPVNPKIWLRWLESFFLKAESEHASQ